MQEAFYWPIASVFNGGSRWDWKSRWRRKDLIEVLRSVYITILLSTKVVNNWKDFKAFQAVWRAFVQQKRQQSPLKCIFGSSSMKNCVDTWGSQRWTAAYRLHFTKSFVLHGFHLQWMEGLIQLWTDKIVSDKCMISIGKFLHGIGKSQDHKTDSVTRTNGSNSWSHTSYRIQRSEEKSAVP